MIRDLRIDEKGKFFTSHVSKVSLEVIAATETHLVRGTMHLGIENRLKDELNGTEDFIALTNAEVSSRDGITPLYHSTVLILNKEQIVWVIPQATETDASATDR